MIIQQGRVLSPLPTPRPLCTSSSSQSIDEVRPVQEPLQAGSNHVLSIVVIGDEPFSSVLELHHLLLLGRGTEKSQSPELMACYDPPTQ